MYDLLIRNGSVIDGTGSPALPADVAVLDGRIVRVARHLEGAAIEVIDAEGSLVTPGFVDVHTHFDGQATWDSLLDPATSHGVTTVIAGNCGVGFAPARPGSHDTLVEMMEGVEDIPGDVLRAGMSWGWESFPEFLDVLDHQRWAADLGIQMAHGALRTYVMEGRAASRGCPSQDELGCMVRLVSDAMDAGALGFSTSRTVGHAALDGTPLPGTFAQHDELWSVARAMASSCPGVFQVAAAGLVASDDPTVVASEMEWMGRLAAETGLTVTFILMQEHYAPRRWRDRLDEAAVWRASGAQLVPLTAGRPLGQLFGWDIRHPYHERPSYEAIDHLPLADRLTLLEQPSMRRRILSESPLGKDSAVASQASASRSFVENTLPGCFLLGDPPDYEQPIEQTVGVLASLAGVSVEAVAYDAMCAGSMLMYPFYNYKDGNHDVLWEQMADPAAVLGLNDAGAHCSLICDASVPTYLLTHWARDRQRGPRLDLVDAVRRLTSQPAELYGLDDRGRIAEGLRADLNVIDFSTLQLRAPHPVRDLPAGGLRLLQEAEGYQATIVHGQVTRRNGVDTGARPGRLIRR